jgi:hypothetical protein
VNVGVGEAVPLGVDVDVDVGDRVGNTLAVPVAAAAAVSTI